MTPPAPARSQEPSQPAIVPFPHDYCETEGYFEPDSIKSILVYSTDLKGVAHYLSAELTKLDCPPIPVVEAKLSTVLDSSETNGCIVFELEDNCDHDYSLSIAPAITHIAAESPQGAFYATQTFLQLVA